nr:MCE family protein [Actinomycetota bacterium]
MKLTSRVRNIISGLCVLVILAGATTIGVKYSFGAFEDGYELVAEFDAAGQGLISGSDIKVRGLNVGHVDSIRLVDGRAEVTMFFRAGQRVPLDAVFTIRPKTLFGEKFIDVELGDAATSIDDSAFFDPDAELEERRVPAENAVGGVELERVLAGLYPILQAVDPAEVATILDTLAAAGDGLGETINRSIVNGDAVLAVTAARDAETRQFLEALALLSDELSGRAPDLIAGAADLNVALPVLTENRESFTALLVQLERVSSDLADVLEGNTEFIDSVYSDGQATLDVLYDRRFEVIPLVTGLRQYVQTLAEVARIPVGDGTVMAAVKAILGGDVCGLLELLDCGAALP